MKNLNFLLFAAGVDEAVLLKRCSSSEKKKFMTLGSLIFIPLFTSIIAVGFACQYYTKNPLLIACICVFWGSFIFILERALISSLRPKTFNLAVVFRIVSAVAMSIIISDLITMFMFKKDITSNINKDYDTQVEAIHSKYGDEIHNIELELAKKEGEVDLQETKWIQEVEGTSGTMTFGYGPVARLDSIATARKIKALETARHNADKKIAAIRQAENEALKNLEKRREPGILSSRIGLQQLVSDENNAKIWLFVFRIFFFCIELMPLVIKMSSVGEQYYTIVDLLDQQHIDVARLLSDEDMKLIRMNQEFELKKRELELQGNNVCAELEAQKKLFSLTANHIKDAVSTTENTEKDILTAKNKNNENRVRIATTKLNKLFEQYLK